MTEWLKEHNKSSKPYVVIAYDRDGNIGFFEMGTELVKEFDALVAKTLKGKRPFDLLDPFTGSFLKFSRKGKGLGTKWSVAIDKEVTVDEDGEERSRIVPAPLTEAEIANILETLVDPRGMFIKLTSEEVAELVESGGEPEVATAVFEKAEQRIAGKKSKKAVKKPKKDEDEEDDDSPPFDTEPGDNEEVAAARKEVEDRLAKKSAKAAKKAAPAEDDDEDEAPTPKVKAKTSSKASVALELDEDEDDEDEAPPPKTKATSPAKKAAPAPEEDEDDEDEAPPPPKVKAKAPAVKKLVEVDDSDDDEEDEPPPPPKKTAAKKPVIDLDEDEDEDDEPMTPEKLIQARSRPLK
jgi:hypothetical protein